MIAGKIFKCKVFFIKEGLYWVIKKETDRFAKEALKNGLFSTWWCQFRPQILIYSV